MKTKLFLILTVIFLVPLLCSTVMVSAIATEWLLVEESYFADLFLTGKFNREMTLVVFGLSCISTAVSMYFAIWLRQHANAIDKLEKIKHLEDRDDLYYLNEIKEYVKK